VKPRPIIVTRAGEPGQALARALAGTGAEVLWLPAFELGPAPDPAHVDAVLARLAQYDLAVFVSPAAVEATAARLKEDWPAGTTIGAVGAGTRRAVLARIRGAGQAMLLAPAARDSEGEAGGSEALLRALETATLRPRRALILRAQHGREWLAENLATAGTAVESLAVYTRRPAPLPEEALPRLRDWQIAQRVPVLVVASSEAVDALRAAFDTIGSFVWLRSGRALAPHERIAERLRACGFTDVRIVALDSEAILQAARAR
jgi:uroporphyrinogen-III synthase